MLDRLSKRRVRMSCDDMAVSPIWVARGDRWRIWEMVVMISAIIVDCRLTASTGRGLQFLSRWWYYFFNRAKEPNSKQPTAASKCQQQHGAKVQSR